jgi:hypothetical protein
MQAATAAAYCDEPSVDAFLRKVAQGVYSQPCRARGTLRKWHREKLARDIARRHGIQCEEPTIADNVEDLI